MVAYTRLDVLEMYTYSEVIGVPLASTFVPRIDFVNPHLINTVRPDRMGGINQILHAFFLI